jgi:uncharacterized protein YbdZ (MbtH family)
MSAAPVRIARKDPFTGYRVDTQEVPLLVAGSLALVRTWEGYSITHIPSGWSVVKARTKTQARKAISKLRKVSEVDWELLTPESATTLPDEVRAKLRAIIAEARL